MSCSDTVPAVEGTIVVFAKCPIPGKSKTRLSSLLGENGSALLAKAMLSDVLMSLTMDERLSGCIKVLVYAPGTLEGESHMKNVLAELDLTACTREDLAPNSQQWMLLPMASNSILKTSQTSSSPKGQIHSGNGKATVNFQPSELLSSDLGSKLADALQRVRNICGRQNPVVFLGMDSPELFIDEITEGIRIASKDTKKAYINPAQDGGYGMLCVPSEAPVEIFSGVRWSSPLTAVSQMKALSDNGIDTIVGSLMSDIDESDDVLELAKRLCLRSSNETNEIHLRRNDLDRLCHPSALVTSALLDGPNSDKTIPIGLKYASCSQTLKVLLKLGIVEEIEEEGGKTVLRIVLSQFEDINSRGW